MTLPYPIVWATADSTMESFGIPNEQWAQLDGGGSTTLMVDGKVYAAPTTGRLLAHIIVIYAGK